MPDCIPFEGVIDILRQRRGLSAADDSQDQLIAQYDARRVVRECCAWELGDDSWAGIFLAWAAAAGYKIEAPPAMEIYLDEATARERSEDFKPGGNDA